jgi:acyl carrier protein
VCVSIKGAGVQRRDVLRQLQSIVREELDDPSIQITDATAIRDLPDWDSAAHVRILVAMEAHFDILIDVEEYTTFTTLKDIVDCVCGKLGTCSPTGSGGP